MGIVVFAPEPSLMLGKDQASAYSALVNGHQVHLGRFVKSQGPYPSFLWGAWGSVPPMILPGALDTGQSLRTPD